MLHEEITSFQAVTLSVAGSARTHFAISINLHVPLKLVSSGYGRGESGNSGEVLEKLVVGDHGETDDDAGKGQTSKVRVSMLFLVLPRWRFQGLSCMVPISERFSTENDWRDRLCLRVLLAPLDLRNVNFPIFIPR